MRAKFACFQFSALWGLAALVRLGLLRSCTAEQELLDIPHILHRVAFASTQAREQQLFQVEGPSCRQLHPAWEHKVWTVPLAEAFLETHYPWFYPTFTSYPHIISKSTKAALLCTPACVEQPLAAKGQYQHMQVMR